MAPTDITIRPFRSLEEYEECVRFQEEIWGRGFSEKVSAAILMIANRMGGLAAGAFDAQGTLHGFVFGLTGVVKGRPVHWSDMLAVRGGDRDRGLGTRLKWYQRETLLHRNIDTVRWTFDPLQGRNAYINFSKLGAVSREYVENMYGDTGSPLHRGIGTDRLIAEWSLNAPRVETRRDGPWIPPALGDFDAVPRALEVEGGEGREEPGRPATGLEGPRVLMAVPRILDTILSSDPHRAIRWREATRIVLQHYLRRGFEATEFVPGRRASYYLLRAPTDEAGR